MAAGGLVGVICVVVVELLLDDLLIIVVFLLLFLTVTRAGTIRHGGLLMGGVVGIGLAQARRGVGRDDHRCMEGVREGLIILRIVHEFRVGRFDQSPEMVVTLRAESCNRCRQRQPNPLGTGARCICPPTRRAFHRFLVHQKFQKKTGLHVALDHSLSGRWDGWNRHGRCPTTVGWDLVSPKFVPMAKTRGNTAAGTRGEQGVTRSHCVTVVSRCDVTAGNVGRDESLECNR